MRFADLWALSSQNQPPLATIVPVVRAKAKPIVPIRIPITNGKGTISSRAVEAFSGKTALAVEGLELMMECSVRNSHEQTPSRPHWLERLGNQLWRLGHRWLLGSRVRRRLSRRPAQSHRQRH